MHFRARVTTSLLFFLAASAAAVGCADPTPQDISAENESDLVGRVKGSTLNSAYAKPSKTYLSVRRLDTLRAVGALSGAVETLANRADGIIANQPADGRISVQELLKMEQPGFIETLFPEEKAALPKVWELLETTTKSPKSTAAAPALPSLTVVDASTPAGTLQQPSKLLVADLPPALQLSAKRVELTHDADNDDATITLGDVNAAIATPGPYTPDEVQDFHAIAKQFLEHATSSYVTRAKVPAPFATSKVIATVGTTGPKIHVDDTLVMRERRDLWLSNPSYAEGGTTVQLGADLTRKLVVDHGPTEKVVAIFEASEQEAVLDGELAGVDAGTVTIEVWSNGQRTTIDRMKLAAALAPATQHLDLADYRDYAFSAGTTPLYKNVVSASSRGVYNAGTSWSAEYVYGTTATPTPNDADAGALGRLATPTSVTAGRYEITAGAAGKVRLDVSPSGVVWVTRLSTGETRRAEVHTWPDGVYFHAQFPDRFRVMLNTSTKELRAFYDGASVLVETTLLASDRTG